MSASATTTTSPLAQDCIQRLKKFQSTPTAGVLFNVLFTLFTFLVALVVIPIYLPTSLLFRIYRNTLVGAVKRREGDRVDIMTSDDSVWVHQSTENRLIINSLIEIKGTPDIEKMRNLWLDRMVNFPDPDNPNQKLYPKFSKYIMTMMRRNVWVEEEEFRIDEHVLLHPENATDDMQHFQAMIGDICSRPLPSRRSPWQFIVVQNPKAGVFYACIRVHHSVGDGVSLVRIALQQMMDGGGPEVKLPVKFATKTQYMKIAKAIVAGPAMLLERFIWPGDKNVLHGPRLSGRKVVVWSKAIDLELIKRMKNATGTTVNDVLMSCLAGAYRQYFMRHGEEMPSNILAYVPVDIRSPKAKLVLDNKFSIVFLSLPLDEADPLDQLMKTKARMDSIKQSPEPIVNSLTLRYAMARLPNWSTRLVIDWLSSKCTMVLSNVPGPQTPLTMLGQEVLDMVFWPPQRSNVGLGVSIFSYNGRVRIGLLVDRTLMSNPGELAEDFNQQVQKLAQTLKLD